jgi:hypothetical protein
MSAKVPVGYLNRESLNASGYDLNRLDDQTMATIADRLSDSILRSKEDELRMVIDSC